MVSRSSRIKNRRSGGTSTILISFARSSCSMTGQCQDWRFRDSGARTSTTLHQFPERRAGGVGNKSTRAGVSRLIRVAVLGPHRANGHRVLASVARWQAIRQVRPHRPFFGAYLHRVALAIPVPADEPGHPAVHRGLAQALDFAEVTATVLPTRVTGFAGWGSAR